MAIHVDEDGRLYGDGPEEIKEFDGIVEGMVENMAKYIEGCVGGKEHYMVSMTVNRLPGAGDETMVAIDVRMLPKDVAGKQGWEFRQLNLTAH